MTRRRFLQASSLACGSVAISGCMKGITQQPHLKEIYEPAAQRHNGDRRPVIVIPEILRSRLETDAGRTVWGAFDNEYANPSRPDGARLVAMPMSRGLSLTSLQDDVQATQVLDRLELTSDPVFTDNVLFTLLEEPRRAISPAISNVVPPLPEF